MRTHRSCDRGRSRRIGAGLALATLIGAIAGLLSVSAVTVAQAKSARATPRVPSAEASAKYLRRRPRSIVYSGDGAALLAGTAGLRSHLRWTTWSDRQARGRGADWHDTCKPSCAQGRYFAYPALIHLYRPRSVGGHRVFTRLTITYTAKHPPYPAYRPRSITYVLRYSRSYGTSYFWGGPH